MISLFRKIRRSLLDSGKVRRYLIYAIGEIALVMIGILLALQVNNWNEQRKDRIIEKKLLQQYRSELNYNLDVATTLKQDMLDRRKCCQLLLEAIDQKKPYHDSWSACSRVLTTSLASQLSHTVYNSIESKGIDVISDDSLKLSILNLHALNYQRLESRITNLVSNINDYGRPIVRHKMKAVSSGVHVPIDYDELVKDVSLWNILQTLDGNFENIADFLDEIQNEIKEIDQLIIENINS